MSDTLAKLREMREEETKNKEERAENHHLWEVEDAQERVDALDQAIAAVEEVTRLREEVARLQTTDAENYRLRKDNETLNNAMTMVHETNGLAKGQIERLRERNTRLKVALKPFAELNLEDEDAHDDWDESYNITAGDIRRARAEFEEG